MSQQLIIEAQRYDSIRERISLAEQRAGREAGSVILIGASKTKTPQQITRFHHCGLTHIGENYLQEALEKKDELASLKLHWHFIGHLQSNKTKLVAQNFDWVHGVDRLKIAKRLASQHRRSSEINLLIQLNLDEEDTKSGVNADQAMELAMQISELEGCRLRGFMTIPRSRDSFDAQRAVFSQAKQLLELTNQKHGLALDHLSMGMSGDMEAAIQEGATMVRVGTALFGPRS